MAIYPDPQALAELGEMIAARRPNDVLDYKVAFGELTFSGRLAPASAAAAEVAALVAELRGLGWLPEPTSIRKDVTA